MDDILTFSKGLWLKQNLYSHCFLSWHCHKNQLSSWKVKRYGGVSIQEGITEAGSQMEENTPWTLSSDSSPRKKNLQNFFCLRYGLRGIENSHLQSDFPHHLTDEQQSGQFLKIKEIEFQLPVSTICLSQINTFHGNSVNLCSEQLQFPLLYSTFPL